MPGRFVMPVLVAKVDADTRSCSPPRPAETARRNATAAGASVRRIAHSTAFAHRCSMSYGVIGLESFQRRCQIRSRCRTNSRGSAARRCCSMGAYSSSGTCSSSCSNRSCRPLAWAAIFAAFFYSRHKRLEGRFGKTHGRVDQHGRRRAHHRRAVRAHRDGVHPGGDADARARSISRRAARRGSRASSAHGAGCSGSGSGATSPTSTRCCKMARLAHRRARRRRRRLRRAQHRPGGRQRRSSCCSRCSSSSGTATRS